MSEKFVRISSYNHAVASHADFALTIAATGLFDRSDRVADEFDLREKVMAFLGSHTGVEPRRIAPVTTEIVPMTDSFAEACTEGYLPASLSGRLAAKAMLHYGAAGRFDELDNVFQAYRASLDVMDISSQIVAGSQLRKTTTSDTPRYSDRISVQQGEVAAVHYGQTLRRLLARSALSEEMYIRRMEEANLRPMPAFMRKLRIF